MAKSPKSKLGDKRVTKAKRITGSYLDERKAYLAKLAAERKKETE